VVHVTGEDAFRLASGTGLPMARFLSYVPQVEPSEAGFVLEADGPTFDLILEHAPSDDPMKPCVFLREDSAGGGRCAVYPIRPGACRRFPAVRRRDGGVGAREDVVCPPGAWTDHPLDGISWRVALERERRDAELYAVVVAEWNARVRAARGHGPLRCEAFLDYLSDTYGWISHLRHALSPRERAGPGLLLRVGEALRQFP
jgi:Fe-S-cluster containining protein